MATKSAQIRLLADEVAKCRQCKDLVANRTQPVFGSGNPNASLVFIGEAPGKEEDETGIPFSGDSGKNFDELLLLTNIERKDVFICNVIRCRPTQDAKNRKPTVIEIANCKRFLERTLEIIQPKYICCLGLYAAKSILAAQLPKKVTLKAIHGQVFEHNGAKVMCTYHPSPRSLQRYPERKQAIEDDLNELVRLTNGK